MTDLGSKEENVTIVGEVTLRGTLTIPNSDKEKFPAILLIPGSGRVDRNENNPQLKLNILNQLAQFFNELGFITLRYDKRGVGESSGEYLKSGLWDLVNDAESVLTYLKGLDIVDPNNILILGHSEGSIIAPMVNERENVQGLILLAGVAESLQQTVIRQNEQVLQEMEKQPGLKGFFYRLLRVSKKGKKDMQETHKKILESTTPTFDLRGKKINAKWMREHFIYDVTEALEKVSCPLIAITGSLDIQVPPDHAMKISNIVNGSAEGHIIEGMNHILRSSNDSNSMMELQSEYKKMGELPLNAEMLTLIDRWLNKYFIKD